MWHQKGRGHSLVTSEGNALTALKLTLKLAAVRIEVIEGVVGA